MSATQRSGLLTRPSTVWIVALLVLAYGLLRFALSGFGAYRLYLAERPGGLYVLALALMWTVPCLIGGVGLLRRKRWSRFFVYLATAGVVLSWLGVIWQSWQSALPGLGGFVVWTGSVAVVILLFSSLCVYTCFRDSAGVPPRPPRWWFGFYVLVGVWLGLLPVFSANASHFGPGFFPMLASIYVAPAIIALLAGDLVIRIVDVVSESGASLARRCWALAPPGLLLVAYVSVFIAFAS